MTTRWTPGALLLGAVVAFLQLGCGPDGAIDNGSGGGGGSGGGAGGGSAVGGGNGTGGGTSGGAGGGTAGSAGGGQGGSGGAGGGGATLTRALSIIVEPSDNAAALKAAISGAHSSVHMTMYMLSNTAIISALIAQKNAGHDVKVMLNQTFPGNAGTNNAVFTQLQTAGVNVHWAPATFTLTHEKCVIIDGATAWIMTMNATASSPSSNREYLAVDTEMADVQEAETIFEDDFSGATTAISGSLLAAPVNARPRMLTALDGASSTIDMEGEELSDAQIVSALVAARNRGVRVRIVLADGTPSPAQDSAVTQLKGAGVSLVTLHTPYIHAKAFVVDGKQAYVGSENFTSNSLIHNRELGVLFATASEVQKVLSTTATDFAAGTPL